MDFWQNIRTNKTAQAYLKGLPAAKTGAWSMTHLPGETIVSLDGRRVLRMKDEGERVRVQRPFEFPKASY